MIGLDLREWRLAGGGVGILDEQPLRLAEFSTIKNSNQLLFQATVKKDIYMQHAFQPELDTKNSANELGKQDHFIIGCASSLWISAIGVVFQISKFSYSFMCCQQAHCYDLLSANPF